MDELTLLRSARSDTPPATEQALAEARAALFELVAAEADPDAAARANRRVRSYPRRHPWRRRIGIAGGAMVAAGVVIGALVMTNVIGFAGWRGGADAAAAGVLHEASVAAIANTDPVLGPGQYLRIDTSAVYGATVIGVGGGAASYLTIVEEQLYIPAERDDEWVWLRPLSRPYATFGPESEEMAQAMWEAVSGERGADYVERLRAPGGNFYSYPNAHASERLDGLPRDPYQLLNHIYRVTLGAGPSPDGEALVWIADTLRSGAVPADLRAALYGAAAMIPGVTVTERQANLDGRTGVAIGRLEEANGIRQDLIIDPESGLLIGERQVLTRDEPGSGFPVGTTISWTAVTTTVVDSAPEGGTPNGSLDEEGCTMTEPGTFDCPPKEGPVL